MGLVLPKDYKELLLLHDGQEGDAEALFEWIPGAELLKPIAEVVEQWREEKGLAEEFGAPEENEDGPFYTDRYHAKRIPIAGTEYWDGDTMYLDLAPTERGKSGQLIALTSECDFVRLGPSLRRALTSYVEALEAGDWGYFEHKGHVGSKDEGEDEHPNQREAFAAYRKAQRRGENGA